MDALLIADLAALAVLILWLGFRHLARRDAEEGQTNREDVCTSHNWGRVAGEGLRCGACGKAAGVGR